ncbi:MAG: hypothetical protein U5J96_05215 [Ignavibacteriaceae bacterium]|nr:hypothetical protein [Ignavibacteriaceae bacterium]
MKRILLSVLVYGMYAGSFAQDPVAPCCNIIVLDIKKNIVVARDITTGRLYQFKADALDMKAINLNDAVNISSGKVTSIGGTKRMYATVQPDDGTPCCAVVSIQPDPADPCCNVVLFKNNTTKNTFSILVPKQIAATLKTGQAVNMDGATGMAIVQSSYGSSNGQMNSYGYSATSEDATTGNENATAKWVITPVPTMKGVLGRLNTSFPEGVSWTIDVRTTEDKFITNRSGSGKHGSSYDIAPGNYYFRLNTITVQDVPIEKGKETRLKAGYLSIVSEGEWNLYDESKKKFHTSGNKPKKIALPVGNYQLKMGGQFFPLLVIDGETIEM